MKNSYEVRAQKFIQQILPIIEKDIFNPYFVENRIANFNKVHKRNICVRYGEARIALITSDYVVKFDYDPDIIEEIGGCENEMKLYAQAVADGFDYLFAKISKYNYKGYAFYIMPRINDVGKLCNRFNYAIQFMNKKEYDWCESHKLTDLHCNNYGFRNGKVCIVDYAYIDECNYSSY